MRLRTLDAVIREVVLKKIIVAVVGLGLTATGTAALDAKVEKDIAADPRAVWTAIGDFCGISTRHPVVAKCVQSEKDGKTFRELTLKDGAKLLEELVSFDKTAMSYTYTILEGPLPVANYKSTLSVTAADKGSKLTWMGQFDANGAPDADAVKIITGIYEGGAAELAKSK